MIARLLVVLLFALTGAVCAEAASGNIVLFVSDDHGCDAGCYGNPVIRTPHLDALADDGVVFDRAYCTTTSCSSSRAVMLTGLHAHANGQYGLGHDEHAFKGHAGVATLPAWLSAAGYRTARVGKLHVYPNEAYPFDCVAAAPMRDPVGMVEAVRDVIAADSERPFFVMIATSDPHRGPRDDEASPLRPNRFGSEHAPPSASGWEEPDPADVVVPPFLPDTPECRAELVQYYRSVSRVDDGLGALTTILRATGHWDDTLVVYVSDHGMPMQGAKTTLYDPGMRSPCVVRDPAAAKRGFRTDEIVSWTDLTPTLLHYAGVLDSETGETQADINRRVSDTIAARHRPGRPAPPVGRLHGRSFLPLVRGDENARGRREAYASHTFHEVTMYYPMRAVVERRYKLIWNLAYPLEFPSAMDLWRSSTWRRQHQLGPDAPYGVRTVGRYLNRPEFELFDLESDPNEAKNLADDSAHAATLARLKTKLQAFQRETADPWLIKWRRE